MDQTGKTFGAAILRRPYVNSWYWFEPHVELQRCQKSLNCLSSKGTVTLQWTFTTIYWICVERVEFHPGILSPWLDYWTKEAQVLAFLAATRTWSSVVFQLRTVEVYQLKIGKTTVDGRNPAPVGMVNIPLVTRFYTSQVAQDFFHQQYVKFESCNNETWYKTWQYVAIRPIAKELFQPTQWGIQKCWTQGSKTTGFHEAAEISWVFLRWPHNGPIVYRVPQWDQSRQGVPVRMEMFWSRVVTRFETLTLLCLLFSRWTFFFERPGGSTMQKAG